MARREEWSAQVRFATLLDKWLDPACTFATAVDNVARDKTSGAMRKKRGVRTGLPDNWVLHRGRLVAIEMKAPGGRCSPVQRETRLAILAAGGQWWECRTAHAAMWALRRSGVTFRTIEHADGTIERWQQPKLAAWEVPRRDPAERRPSAPHVTVERRAYQRRWRERRQRKRQWERELAAEAAQRTQGGSMAIGTLAGGAK